MKHNNQSGFTVVEIVIIVAVVGLIGFAGFTVWNNQQKDEPTDFQATANDQRTEQIPIDGSEQINTVESEEPFDPGPTEVITGSLYTAMSKKWQITLPDGWKFRDCNEGTVCLVAAGTENMTYQQGIPASVTREYIAPKGGPTATSFSVGYNENGPVDPSSRNKDFEYIGTINADSGLTVKKYKLISVEGDYYSEAGTIHYSFTAESGNRVFTAGYLQSPGDPDMLVRVETMVKSFVFL